MGHSDGYMTFPWGLNITLQSVETAKDTQSNKVVADTLPTYACGPTSFQTLPQKAVIVSGNMWSDRGTTWILSLPSIGAKLGILPGKGPFVWSLEMSHNAHNECALQRSIRCNS